MAGLVVAADQLSKSLAQSSLESGNVHVLGPLDLELSYNPGVAFSLGQGLSPSIVEAGVLVVVAILAFNASFQNRTSTAAAGLVIGGALSNLADRLFRGHGGAVIDWIHLSHWPTFNVADSCVVLGVALLILANLREGGVSPRARRAGQTSPADGGSNRGSTGP